MAKCFYITETESSFTKSNSSISSFGNKPNVWCDFSFAAAIVNQMRDLTCLVFYILILGFKNPSKLGRNGEGIVQQPGDSARQNSRGSELTASRVNNQFVVSGL